MLNHTDRFVQVIIGVDEPHRHELDAYCTPPPSPAQLSVQRIYTGSFVTSLDMAGISLTLLKLGNDDSLLTLLDAPVGAPAWPAASAVVGPAPKKPVPVPKPPSNAAVQGGGEDSASSSSEAPTEAGLQLSAAIKAIAESLIAAAEELNALDKKVYLQGCLIRVLVDRIYCTVFFNACLLYWDRIGCLGPVNRPPPPKLCQTSLSLPDTH